jgi:hypothetical protein
MPLSDSRDAVEHVSTCYPVVVGSTLVHGGRAQEGRACDSPSKGLENECTLVASGIHGFSAGVAGGKRAGGFGHMKGGATRRDALLRAGAAQMKGGTVHCSDPIESCA